MKKIVSLCALASGAALIALALPGQGEAQNQGAIVVEGGTLIDGNGGRPVADSAIVIQGNRITAVGRRGQVDRPANAQVIDARGKFIMPGLIDAKANYAANMNEPYIEWGVTAAVWSGGGGDVGIALRDAINHGVMEGPRLFVSYAAVNGGGMDGQGKDNGIPGRYGYVVNTPQEAHDIAVKFFDAGADFISSGNGDASPAVFKALVDEAKRRGKASVMRSVGPGTAAKELADMGTDVAIHYGQACIQITTDATVEKWKNYVALPPDSCADMDDAKARAMAKYLADRNLALEPDIIAMDRGFLKNWSRIQQENAQFQRDYLANARMQVWYPAAQVAGYVENVKSPDTYLTPEALDLRRRGYQNKMRFLKMFVDAGGKMVTASDIPQAPPGLGVHQEMAAFVEDVGLTPMQAILAATGWAADAFKQPDIGRIQVGKLADLVILDADPTRNILNTRRINTVIKDGKVADRAYNATAMNIFQGVCCNGNPVIEGEVWAAAVKQATWNPNARNGGWGNVGGIDSEVSAPPGIEGIMPYTINRGSPATTVRITGFNFVTGSKVLVDGKEVPTKVNSRTEVEASLDAALLNTPGVHSVVVKNPEPLARNMDMWGLTSNKGNLLVPYEFTRVHSNNLF